MASTAQALTGLRSCGRPTRRERLVELELYPSFLTALWTAFRSSVAAIPSRSILTYGRETGIRC